MAAIGPETGISFWVRTYTVPFLSRVLIAALSSRSSSSEAYWHGFPHLVEIPDIYPKILRYQIQERLNTAMYTPETMVLRSVAKSALVPQSC